jgi:signal transduction histidine kinase
MHANPHPWRSTTTRLLAIYGVFFSAWAIVLLSLIYWETSQYLTEETEHLLGERAEYFASIDPGRLRERLESTYEFDLLHLNAYGLFNAKGEPVAGNIHAIPAGLEPDGHGRVYRERFNGSETPASTRILAIRLRNGYELVLARNAALIDRLHQLISRAIAWGLSLTVFPGLLGGLVLSIRPRRRIRSLQAASDRIVTGDLHQRLPLSGRGDELDNLASVVNRMLDKVERLMFEVKNVCDNLAHDLRTPLTHLRAQLYRLQQQTAAEDIRAATIDQAVAETDDLLARFAALLRISELKDEHRRAGFKRLDLIEVLHQVYELYEPLAEEKSISFKRFFPNGSLQIQGDRHLLIEAFSNLVGNAIKFTPVSGEVAIQVLIEIAGARVDVTDNGPGIAPDQREAIFQRFFRGDQSRSTPGFGLGLSIVEAILRLHDFQIQVGNPPIGACLTVLCWPAPLAYDSAGIVAQEQTVSLALS